MEKYTILETIGDGTYGVVLKAINSQNNEIYAIKKMKKIYQKWEECLSLKEVKSLMALKHPNIVSLYEVILSDSELFLVFEYMGMNLYDYSQRLTKDIPENTIRNIIFQVLQALAFINQQNYFHRDMKPENIIISEEIIKVADFGLAKECTSKPPFTEYVATRWYRAPEVILKSKIYNSSIDIFAVGAIMAELYLNRPLFPGKSEIDQLYKICEIMGSPSQSDWADGFQLAAKLNYKFPNLKSQKIRKVIGRANDDAVHLLESMLQFNPLKRPTAQQCLQHPFFQCFNILYLFGLKPFDSTAVKKEEKSSNSEKSTEKKPFIHPQLSKKISGMGAELFKIKQDSKEKLQLSGSHSSAANSNNIFGKTK